MRGRRYPQMQAPPSCVGAATYLIQSDFSRRWAHTWAKCYLYYKPLINIFNSGMLVYQEAILVVEGT